MKNTPRVLQVGAAIETVLRAMANADADEREEIALELRRLQGPEARQTLTELAERALRAGPGV